MIHLADVRCCRSCCEGLAVKQKKWRSGWPFSPVMKRNGPSLSLFPDCGFVFAILIQAAEPAAALHPLCEF